VVPRRSFPSRPSPAPKNDVVRDEDAAVVAVDVDADARADADDDVHAGLPYIS